MSPLLLMSAVSKSRLISFWISSIMISLICLLTCSFESFGCTQRHDFVSLTWEPSLVTKFETHEISLSSSLMHDFFYIFYFVLLAYLKCFLCIPFNLNIFYMNGKQALKQKFEWIFVFYYKFQNQFWTKMWFHGYWIIYWK